MRVVLTLALVCWAVPVHAAPVYTTGWDTYEDEGETTVGTPVFGAAYKRAANAQSHAGLYISDASDERWCVDLDTELAEQGFVPVHVYVEEGALQNGASSTVAYYELESGNRGCALVLEKDGAGNYTVKTVWEGQELGAKSFSAIGVQSGEWNAFGLGQSVNVSSKSVSCPTYFRGNLVQDFSIALCGGSACQGATACAIPGNCDIDTVCMGTPSGESVSGIRYDDLLVDDNVTSVGLFDIHPLVPNAAGTLREWVVSGSCSSEPTNHYDCIDDWGLGAAANACDVTTGGADQRRKDASGKDDFNIEDLATLGADETIDGVRAVWSCCNTDGGASATLNTYVKSLGTQDAGDSVVIAADGSAWLEQLELLDSGGGAWSESDVNGIEIGMDKPANQGDGRCTAALLYVARAQPIPPIDTNWPDRTADGQLTLCGGCDSITTSTATTQCTGGASASCTAACTVDSDCVGYDDIDNPASCNTDGQCETQCEFNADCVACGNGTPGSCPDSGKWYRQLVTKVPQFENVFGLAQDGRTNQFWWRHRLTEILAGIETVQGSTKSNAILDGNPVEVIKGSLGHCSGDSTISCIQDTPDCSGNGTCTFHDCDLILPLCGGNDVWLWGGGLNSCDFTSGVHPWCPEPRTVPTPGAFQSDRVRCDNCAGCTTEADRDSYCGTEVAANAICAAGFCEGHEDPTWLCEVDAQCSKCDGEDKRCSSYNSGSWAGVCVVDATGLQPSGAPTCDDDTDCAAGESCLRNNIVRAEHAPSCDVCEHLNCDTTGNRYCTIPCPALDTCTTNADCDGPRYGGVCNSGTCESCALFFTVGGPMRDGDKQSAIYGAAQRLGQDAVSVGALAVTQMTEADTAGVDMITLNYMGSVLPYYFPQSQGGREFIAQLNRILVEDIEESLNLDHLFEHRCSSQSNATSNTFAGTCTTDTVHNSELGALVMADAIAAAVDTTYSVCDDDTSVVCAYCEVPCAVNGDCNGTCSGGNCTCSVDGDCPDGTCEDIGGGTMRCTATALAGCSDGDQSAERQLLVDDDLCTGTCDVIRNRPRCTVTQGMNCTTDADCAGEANGDICALWGAWLECSSDVQCRDGGAYLDDVCALAATGPTTPTPTGVAHCRQPTPTPTP